MRAECVCIAARIYDPTGQLVQAGSQSYSFDANGNPSGTGTQIGPDNELLSNGSFDFTYDAEGNEISKTTIATGDKWVYAYNNANELVSAVETASDGTVEKQVAYKYDALGNLIEEDVTVPNQPTSVTRFALTWTGTGGPSPGTSTADVNWRVWSNLDGSSSLTTRFLNGPAADEVFAELTGSDPTWLLADVVGSTRDVVDNTGNLLDSINYDAFGGITSQSAPSQQPCAGYAGYRRDVGTGLWQSGWREYDPALMRWISQDPLEVGSNYYEYVGNAPTANTDPSGLEGERYVPFSPTGANSCLGNYGSQSGASSRLTLRGEDPTSRAAAARGATLVPDPSADARAGRALAAQEAFQQLNDPTWGTVQRQQRIGNDRLGEPIYGMYREKTRWRIAEERRLVETYNRHIADLQLEWEQRRTRDYNAQSLAGIDQQIGPYPRRIATSSDPTEFGLQNARTFGDWVRYGLRQALRGLQVAASAAEVVIGITSASTGIGVAVTIHGLDGLQAGLRSILSDDDVGTLTSEAVTRVASLVAPEDQARVLGNLSDLTISVLATGPGNIVRTLGSGNIMAGAANVPAQLSRGRVGMQLARLSAADTRLLAERTGPQRLPIAGEPKFVGPLTLEQHYARAVRSNRPWSWAEDIPGGANLTAGQRRSIRQNAISQGLIPDVPYVAGTRFADFNAAGLVRRTDTLPQNLWLASDAEQFAWLDARIPGGRPAGTTWHHSHIPGRMELVPFGPHNVTSHVGGRSPGMWADAPR